jgi:ABC-type dipeptide/oligopeptide/nickel transport system permease component
MLAYSVRRIAQAVPILLGVVFIVMISLEFIPGDPVRLMLGEFATEEMVTDLRGRLGLDDPLYVRYARYVGELATGDMGRSVRDQRPVTDILGEALPMTLRLGAAALLLTVVLGVTLGVVSAARANTVVDDVIRVVSLVGLSMPVFWTGLVFIVFFSVNLRWFPVSGSGSLAHLILPAVTLSLPSIAILARLTRSSVLEVLGEDYVRTARSKGIHDRGVLFKHTLRNALIPVVTALGIIVGQMVGGAVLTETVFAWPGVGRLTVFAIFNRDYVLVQGIVVVLAAAYIFVNLLVDLSYGLIDPRITYS